MEKECPLEVISFARQKQLEWNGSKKADMVICGYKNFGWSKEVKCSECKSICFYSGKDELSEFKKAKIKKVCISCALKNHKEDMPESMIKFLEDANGKRKD
jgi:hypothetical protein